MRIVPVGRGYQSNKLTNSNNESKTSHNQLNYTTYTDSNFQGLTKALKNRIFLDGQKDIELLLKKHEQISPMVGQLPNYIFKKLPKENRAAAIKEIYAAFDQVALTIRDYVPEGDAFIFKPSLRYRPESVNKILEDVLRKYNVITKWDDIDVQYIDQGGKGKVFKIDGLRDWENEDEYVIKVFHQIKGKEWHPFKSHGCYAEINNGIYWKNHEGLDTHRGKFFFASLGSGYIVSKFLDEDVPLPARVVDEYKYGIKCTDEEKDGPITGYNRIKGYNYDYGGMRVVNNLKNTNKVARKELIRMKQMSSDERSAYWHNKFKSHDSTENELAGITMSIKYMDNKSYYIDKALGKNLPKVNQALAYVLKYLDYDEAYNYFKILVQTDDEETQRILFNEIPLLAKRKDEGTVIHDDITVTLGEIIPERIYQYYLVSESNALPTQIEHLASFIHLLPKNKMKYLYMKLAKTENDALHERLIWKLSYLPKDFQEFAIKKLADSITNETLKERLAISAKRRSNELMQEVEQIFLERAQDPKE